MDEQLLRVVTRQLRTIKIMLGLFFFMLIVALTVLGFIAYKVITFTHDVSTRITSIQNQTSQSLDLKSKVCNNSSLASLLGSGSDICK